MTEELSFVSFFGLSIWPASAECAGAVVLPLMVALPLFTLPVLSFFLLFTPSSQVSVYSCQRIDWQTKICASDTQEQQEGSLDDSASPSTSVDVTFIFDLLVLVSNCVMPYRSLHSS